MNFFWIKKLLSQLLLPPFGPLLLVFLGLLLLNWYRRAGVFLAWTGALAALIFMSPLTVGWMLAPLEREPVLVPSAVTTAQAIVILGAGKRRHAPEYDGETVNRLALERLRYGARIAHDSGLPILVSGGTIYGKSSEATLMQEALEIDFQMPVRWIEDQAMDTRENARYSAKIFKTEGVERIILVTHAAHMPRAQAEFELQGLSVIPAPTGWLGGTAENGRVLPTAASAYAGWVAAHEWVGRLVYGLVAADEKSS